MLALSGGEPRRVDLACTLMGDPELVILDEPTTGLDPESRREVWRLVAGLRDGGATVLLTTHYLEEAETLADRLEIMHAGRIVRSGTPAEIAEGHPSTISFAHVAGRARPTSPASAASSSEYGRTTLETDELQRLDDRALAWAAAQRRPARRARRPQSRASRPCSSRSPTAATTGGARPRPQGRKPPMSTTTVADRFSLKRAAGLTRWNAVLLSRNRLAFVYAVVLPLLPLLLLFTGERGDAPWARARSSPCSW